MECCHSGYHSFSVRHHTESLAAGRKASGGRLVTQCSLTAEGAEDEIENRDALGRSREGDPTDGDGRYKITPNPS